MNDFHKIGSFIKLKMMEQNKSIQSLAEESEYSTKDIGKILDGRLFLSPKQIEEIAGILDLDINEMINCIDVDSIEYVGEFIKEENKDKLIDYIDRYVDLKEAT